MTIRVLVWNEGRHEQRLSENMGHYPRGIHNALAESLTSDGYHVRTGTLDDLDQGLSPSVLAETDVLVWWGHIAHAELNEDAAALVQSAVLAGMGFIALHSAHHSKPFRRLMGTSCNLTWREHPGGERVRLWATRPSHRILRDLPSHIEIPRDEMYGEPFDIPEPDETVLIGWYEGGEVFRAGCCFRRGNGHIFYLSAGHETFPVYNQPEVKRLIGNAVAWAAPMEPREPIVIKKRSEPLNLIRSQSPSTQEGPRVAI